MSSENVSMHDARPRRTLTRKPDWEEEEEHLSTLAEDLQR
jgi:hypothetical protein